MVVRNSALVLNVRRSEPELVRPARPTPNEVMPLSDVDVRDYLRFQVSVILAYPGIAEDVKDPAKVIKAALGEALVFYYPWAGRLREVPGGRLLVDCTAEGVVFVEANADVGFHHFGELVTPFPCAEEFFYNKASNTFGVVACPLFTIQVTRLVCGGFIAAFNFSHVMSDAIGVVKFLNTVAELSRGAAAPSILPVWGRELLKVPCVTLTRAVKDEDNQIYISDKEMVSRTFIFEDGELAALRDLVLEPCTTFELISACIWRCRTIALQYLPEEQVRFQFAVNVRSMFDPPLPAGFYGNAFAFGVCGSQAREICNRSLGYSVHLVKKAKGSVTEYIKSSGDLMGLTPHPNPNVYVISDVSSRIVGFPTLDFGWGKPVYAGPPGNEGSASHRFSYMLAHGNANGKMLSVSLPVDAMDRFVNALDTLLNHSKGSFDTENIN